VAREQNNVEMEGSSVMARDLLEVHLTPTGRIQTEKRVE